MLAALVMPGIPAKEQRERRLKAAAAGREAAGLLRGALAAAAVAACSAAEAGTEYGAVLRPRWAERSQRGAPRVVVKFQPKGDVTEDGWTQIFVDYGQEGPALGAGETMKDFYRHYQISAATFSEKRKKYAKKSTLAPAPRSGRPGFYRSEAFQKQLRAENKRKRGQSSNDLRLQLDTPAGHTYDKEAVPHPSHNTVIAAKKYGRYRTVGTKLRPAIRKELEPVRVDMAEWIIAKANRQQFNVDNDEKWFWVPMLKSGDLHPESEEEDEEVMDEFFRVVGHKSHIPKIMVFAVTSKPVLNEGWTEPWKSPEEPGNQWKSDGKVFICRCTMEEQRQQGKKKRDAQGKVVRERRMNPVTKRMNWYDVYEKKAGDWEEADSSMDGKMYYDIHINRGCLKAIRDYSTAAGNRGPVIVQNDGAPGHAYNNKATGENGMPGAKTSWRDELEEKAAAAIFKIEFKKQSAHSPELNMLDLGVWSMLNSAVRKRWQEFMEYTTQEVILNKLWEVIQDEWKKIDPAKLYCIAEHKVDIAEQVKKAGGKKLKKEAHGGARRRTEAAIKAAAAK